MDVIGHSHLIWRSRVADYISRGNTIVRIVPIEVGLNLNLNSLLVTRQMTLFHQGFRMREKLVP